MVRCPGNSMKEGWSSQSTNKRMGRKVNINPYFMPCKNYIGIVTDLNINTKLQNS